ncbi:diaminopimelate epimerase [Oceanibaculum nanhaiense]|uniref:diaminopimelate epimerase n=1 Tax=Oceanibaculum nanhaiense TaxID=1909734 RepID=UPI000A38908A|nr:diaminopimelate epimerase [Oceanibaculum nanhaiense]
MEKLPFIKMHGLGNDFVVLDGRAAPIVLSEAQIRAIADRRTGVGFDQMIVIEPPKNGADAYMRILNADGGEVEACGNATRCVASWLSEEADRPALSIETVVGTLLTNVNADGTVTVDMGEARLGWDEIPLAREMDTLKVMAGVAPLTEATCVNVGNPHAVYFVDDVESVPMAEIGPRIEHDPMFPQRINVEAVQILSPTKMRMRVWERGVGITRACGTGACASLVAAVRRGLSERKADVILDGGTLTIEWTEDGRVLMTGPVAISYRGELEPSVIGAA